MTVLSRRQRRRDVVCAGGGESRVYFCGARAGGGRTEQERRTQARRFAQRRENGVRKRQRRQAKCLVSPVRLVAAVPSTSNSCTLLRAEQTRHSAEACPPAPSPRPPPSPLVFSSVLGLPSGTEVTMLSSLPKRPASVSPDEDRPSKRQATSSPEEGELDDASPPPPPIARTPSPSHAPPPKKVPFPFKKRAAAPENGVGANGASAGSTSRERERDRDRDRDRGYDRDDDSHRRFGLPPRPDDRRQWAPDRWEPGPDRYDRSRWESQSYRPYRSPSPPRHVDRRRASSRSRSPSSPRSPLTPSSGKEKHRLPPSRPVVPDPAAYRTVFDRERWNEEDERYGRRRDPYDDFGDRREGASASLRRWFAGG